MQAGLVWLFAQVMRLGLQAHRRIELKVWTGRKASLLALVRAVCGPGRVRIWADGAGSGRLCSTRAPAGVCCGAACAVEAR